MVDAAVAMALLVLVAASARASARKPTKLPSASADRAVQRRAFAQVLRHDPDDLVADRALCLPRGGQDELRQPVGLQCAGRRGQPEVGERAAGADVHLDLTVRGRRPASGPAQARLGDLRVLGHAGESGVVRGQPLC